MIAPISDKVEIVSPWGKRTLSFVNGGKQHFHPGVDIHAPQGAEIIAPCACKLLRVGTDGYGDHFTVVQSLDTLDVFKFIHCGWLDSKAGIEYAEGAVVAISDGSGTSDGSGGKAPHLHFETWRGGQGWTECGGVNYNPEEFFKRYGIPYTIRG